MVRICAGRMSGTAHGTAVFHVAPEAAAGGPLARVRNGDIIALDVPGRRLAVEVNPDDFAARPADPRMIAGLAGRSADGSSST